MNIDQYLRQLPISRQDGKEIFDLSPEEKQKAFNRAWEVFTTGEFHQRWEVAKFLPKFGDYAIAPLSELLEDDGADIDIRCEAAEILAKFQHSDAIFALTEVLKSDTDPEVITACANGLAQNGNVAIPTLTEALDNPETRLAAVQALAYIRRGETIDPLLSVVDDPQPEIRTAAIEALSSFRASPILNVLIQALQDTHPSVRKEAVIALGVRGDSDPETVVPALHPLLYDINSEICGYCAIALGRIGTAQAINLLYDCLQSSATPIPLRQQLVQGISYWETQQSLTVLARSLREQPIPVLQTIIDVLGRWKTTESKPVVAQQLMDGFQENPQLQTNPSLKQTLAMAMGNLGVSCVKNFLSELAQDETPIVQLHAQSALKKLS